MPSPGDAANSLARPYSGVPAGASDWSEQVGRVWRGDARSFHNQAAAPGAPLSDTTAASSKARRTSASLWSLMCLLYVRSIILMDVS